MVWTHYSSSKIEQFNEVVYCKGDCIRKPSGLYFSRDNQWKEWCDSEEFRRGEICYTLSNIDTLDIFTLDYSSVLHFETEFVESFDRREKPDLTDFFNSLLKDPERDGIKKPKEKSFYGIPKINWELMYKKFDGIVIEYDDLLDHLDENGKWWYFIRNFDVDSLCVWKKAKIELVN